MHRRRGYRRLDLAGDVSAWWCAPEPREIVIGRATDLESRGLALGANFDRAPVLNYKIVLLRRYLIGSIATQKLVATASKVKALSGSVCRIFSQVGTQRL